MKHFINNPLFASTLLNLKQAEEAQHSETAIPFHREYPLPTSRRRELPRKVSALPKLERAAFGERRAPHVQFAFLPRRRACADG